MLGIFEKSNILILSTAQMYTSPAMAQRHLPIGYPFAKTLHLFLLARLLLQPYICNLNNLLLHGMKAKLKKALSLTDVISISAGVMISSGLFVLPSLAYEETGSSMILSYFIGSLMIVPTIFTKAELVTAMPKTGGIFFFTDRSMGPMMGTLAGFIGWFSLAFKSAFSLLAIGIFIILLEPDIIEWQIKLVAVGVCILFTIINILGVKFAGKLQVAIVIILVVSLVIYTVDGLFHADFSRMAPFTPNGINSIFTTAGLIFISFSGTTKIASIAGEVQNPRRNLPLGMFYSWAIVSVLYVLVVFVTVAVVPADRLVTSLTPISLGGEIIMGKFGFILMTIAGLLAFVSTGNAGLLAASRNPLAMSKEGLIPKRFGRINPKSRTPGIAILVTGLFMIGSILFLDLKTFVKTASSLVLLLFIIANIALIFMRESNIKHYKPSYKSPFYPWIQIIGIAGYSFLLIDMGAASLFVIALFIAVGLIWYFVYARGKIKREYALLHIIERITGIKHTDQMLEEELREILLERDQVTDKRFLKLIKKCPILDIETERTAAQLAEKVADLMYAPLHLKRKRLLKLIAERKQTPEVLIQSGIACLSVPIRGHNKLKIMMVRDRKGIIFSDPKEPVYCAFIIIYSPDEWNFQFHSISWFIEIAEVENFETKWLAALSEEELRRIILALWKRRTPQRVGTNILSPYLHHFKFWKELK